MKRKLKPLVQILNENPDHFIDEDGNFFLKGCKNKILSNTLDIFGKTISVDGYGYFWHNSNIKLGFDKSWFEPMPEKEQWYEVVFHKVGNKEPYRTNYLCKSKEDFLSDKKESDYHWIKLIPFEIGENK